jgi:methylated-DNA-[protein]-cysteine S-methyltransferase
MQGQGRPVFPGLAVSARARHPMQVLSGCAPMLELQRHGFASPLGKLVLLADAQGALRALDWFDCGERMQQLLDRQYGRGGWSIKPSTQTHPAQAALRAYFEGELGALEGIARVSAGTAFQQRVWQLLEMIVPGATRSYAALAAALEAPNSTRAVAAAVAANPLCLLRPCHRVIAAGGALGGYSGGVERKRWLLEHEGLLPRLAHGASGRATRL